MPFISWAVLSLSLLHLLLLPSFDDAQSRKKGGEGGKEDGETSGEKKKKREKNRMEKFFGGGLCSRIAFAWTSYGLRDTKHDTDI